MNNFSIQVFAQISTQQVWGTPLKIKIGDNEVSIASERLNRDNTEYLSIHLAVFDINEEMIFEKQSPDFQDLLNAVEFAKTYNQSL